MPTYRNDSSEFKAISDVLAGSSSRVAPGVSVETLGFHDKADFIQTSLLPLATPLTDLNEIIAPVSGGDVSYPLNASTRNIIIAVSIGTIDIYSNDGTTLVGRVSAGQTFSWACGTLTTQLVFSPLIDATFLVIEQKDSSAGLTGHPSSGEILSIISSIMDVGMGLVPTQEQSALPFQRGDGVPLLKTSTVTLTTSFQTLLTSQINVRTRNRLFLLFAASLTGAAGLRLQFLSHEESGDATPHVIDHSRVKAAGFSVWDTVPDIGKFVQDGNDVTDFWEISVETQGTRFLDVQAAVVSVGTLARVDSLRGWAVY